MNDAGLNDEHRDALQEIVNMAMGGAGAALARLLESFVRLSVPRIQLLNAHAIPSAITEMIGAPVEITAVRQSFACAVRGEALVLFGQAGCAELADLMGYTDAAVQGTRREIVLDVANVLVGACIGGIFEQFGMELGFSAPSIMGENIAVTQLIQPDTLQWRYALLVDVNFGLESRGFTCHLLVLMPEESMSTLRESIERFVAAL